MPLRELFKNDELMYRVVVDEETGQGIMIVTIPSVGWYDLHFRLTHEELAMLNGNQAELDDLAQRFAVDKGVRFYGDRLIQSR